MSFSKVIPLGSVGSVEITEAGGVAAIAIVANATVGGGELAGFATASSSTKVSFSAKQLFDAGMDYAAHKYPGAASIIESLKAFADAEMPKA